MEGGSISVPIRFGRGADPAVQLTGEWRPGDGFLEFAGPGEGTLTVENTAARVGAELSTADGREIVVGVREDGPPLDREWCGEDCWEDAERGAATRVTGRRLYRITRRVQPERHELTLEVDAPGLRIHEIRFE